MKKISAFGLGAVVTALALWLSGCGGTGTPSAPTGSVDQGSGTTAGMDHEGHDHEGHDREGEGDDHEGHDHEASADDAAAIEAALAELSPEDQALAASQKICPVSGHALGSMGKPIKLEDINGQTVFICCEGCESKLRDDPETYLAKLQEQATAPEDAAEGDETD